MSVDGTGSLVERTLNTLRGLDPVPQVVPDAPRTLADLYRDHRVRLVRLAMLLVDDPATAEDVVQEAFTGLHRHWTGLRDEAAAIGYLRTAVVNGSRSVLRRRRTAREYVPPHQVNARSAESLAMLSAEHQAVVDALAMLPPRQREVLVLRYYGGLSESEIADATGISRGTVKSTASRAIDAVAHVLRPGDGPRDARRRPGTAARRGAARTGRWSRASRPGPAARARCDVRPHRAAPRAARRRGAGNGARARLLAGPWPDPRTGLIGYPAPL